MIESVKGSIVYQDYWKRYLRYAELSGAEQEVLDKEIDALGLRQDFIQRMSRRIELGESKLEDDFNLVDFQDLVSELDEFITLHGRNPENLRELQCYALIKLEISTLHHNTPEIIRKIDEILSSACNADTILDLLSEDGVFDLRHSWS